MGRILLFVGIILLILIGAGAGMWWYLFGPNEIESAELVPADTVFFASIPNAARIVAGYQNSALKKLADSPDSKPVTDAIVEFIGQKNLDLINAFLPNLSGQSFIAITHFDADHPEQTGFIAAMKPKPGTANFDSFVTQLKATWPDILKEGTPGSGTVAGVSYQSLKGPGATDKICVAQVQGWIVTTWGEAPLQDWIERFNKKSASPSLAQKPDYQKSLDRVGKDSLTFLYLDYHSIFGLFQKQLDKVDPKSGEYLKKLAALGGMAVGTRFENGQIVDRYSFLMPKDIREDSGIGTEPCAFDTLKFTGPTTRFYSALSVNWPQYWKRMQKDISSATPGADAPLQALQAWCQGSGFDFQHNVIDALGHESSLQMEWNDDTTYPEFGVLIKLDKPDDFKPVAEAIINNVKAAFITSAVIRDLNVPNGPTLAALKFVQPSPFSPTITEAGGDYFGVFSSEHLAVRVFSRIDDATLPHNPSFIQQIGDKRNGASQIIYVDTPKLLDRTYQTALPYLSLASMFNKDVAKFLQGKNLPKDLGWLAPIGTWSCVASSDNDGVTAYSVSGVGNQGLYFLGATAAAMNLAESMGMLPKTAVAPPVTLSGQVTPPPIGTAAAPAPTTPDPSTNAPASAAPAASDQTPATNSVPSTNSDSNATPPAPTDSQPH